MFESAWMLRGLDRFLMDLALNPELALSLMDKLLNYHKAIGRILVKQGVDLIYTGDDVGAQNGMLISPEFFREHMKPRYQQLWSELKQMKPDLFIAHHTCGHVVPVIDDFIEAGLDILNPLQPKAMDIYEIKRKYGDKLSFWGGVDIQGTLPFGNKESIFREVKQLAEGMGKNGGYIISPAHAIQYDTSVENIEYFYQAAKELGKYE
jgi:uroporphyrinogen decarboxylase